MAKRWKGCLKTKECDFYEAKVTCHSHWRTIEMIRSRLSPQQLKTFEEMCFGHFLRVHNLQFSGQLCESMKSDSFVKKVDELSSEIKKLRSDMITKQEISSQLKSFQDKMMLEIQSQFASFKDLIFHSSSIKEQHVEAAHTVYPVTFNMLICL